MCVLATGELEFARHGSHRVRLSSEYESAGQSMHVATGEVENLPGAHSSHTSVPRLVLYVPAWQPTHFFELVPVHPALHAQSSVRTLPVAEPDSGGHGSQRSRAGTEYVSGGHTVHGYVDAFTAPENLPTAQSVHVPGPESSLYLPATQATQVPLTPGHPALHEQLALKSLPAAECEFAGHSVHCDRSSAGYEPASQGAHRSVDAFTAAEALPATHTVHAWGPGSSLYLPAAQPTHSPSVLDQPAVQKQSELSSLPCRECEPAWHSTHCELSSEEYEPAAQCVQLFTGEATAAEKNPLSHCTHPSWDRACTLYLPAGQAVQLPAVEYPALHLHAATLSLPAGASECALHETHVERSSDE